MGARIGFGVAAGIRRILKAGVFGGSRGDLNFVEGANTSITVTDDPGSDKVDVTIAASAGGVTDHGALTGLADDDHPQYATDSDLSTHAAAVDPHTGYRLESADHSHATTGLQAGTVAHTVLTAVGTDDHHAKSHAHNGADGSGSVAHSNTSGITATDHHVAPAAGPDGDITVDGVGAAGTAATFARSAHGHRVNTYSSAPPAVGTGAAGASGAISRGDHTHDHTPQASTAGPDADVMIDTAAAAGTAATFARSAHGHKLSTYSSAAAAIGTAAAGTSGTAPPRGDHVHPTGAGTPSTQALGDAASVGSGPAAPMTDHKHAMPDSTAGPDADVTVDVAGAAGTIHTAARSGHGHKVATYSTTPASAGQAAAGTSGDAPSRGSHIHPGLPLLANDPGSFSITTKGSTVIPIELALSSTERATLAGTARATLTDKDSDSSVVRYRAPGSITVMPDEFILEINRVDLRGTARKTMVGNARVQLTDLAPAGRLVLAGYGG